MANETYNSEASTYKIFVNPAPADGKKYPVILLVHRDFGPPYGEQIQSFARDLADLGYLTAVPQHYVDDEPHLTDTVPKSYTRRRDRRCRRPRRRRRRSAWAHGVFARRRDGNDRHRNESPPGRSKLSQTSTVSSHHLSAPECAGFRPQSSSTARVTRSFPSRIRRNSTGCCQQPPITN
jgi:hypothetical protein